MSTEPFASGRSDRAGCDSNEADNTCGTCPRCCQQPPGRCQESAPFQAHSGDGPTACPHGSCCEGFGYVISFIEYLLDTSPKDSPEWLTAARIMDEVGK